MPDLRKMQPKDVAQVVVIHRAAFPGFFLSFLGGPFLTVFYGAVLRDRTSIALVSENHGGLTGFVVGTTEPGGFYKRTLIRFWPRFIFASLVPLVRRPLTIAMLVRRLLLVKGSRYEPGEALLMSIAVDPTVQGGGIGRALLAQFLYDAKQKGASIVNLSTDEVNNDSVNQFYRHAGFVCRRSYATLEGRRMNAYCRRL